MSEIAIDPSLDADKEVKRLARTMKAAEQIKRARAVMTYPSLNKPEHQRLAVYLLRTNMTAAEICKLLSSLEIQGRDPSRWSRWFNDFRSRLFGTADEAAEALGYRLEETPA